MQIIQNHIIKKIRCIHRHNWKNYPGYLIRKLKKKGKNWKKSKLLTRLKIKYMIPNYGNRPT